MKKLLLFIVILTFAGLTYLNNSFQENAEHNNVQPIKESIYSDGLLRSEINNVEIVASYKIDAELHPDEKKIFVAEELTWENKTKFTTREIYLHLYPNAYKNNNTLFSKGRGIKINDKNKSEINFSEIKIKGKVQQLIFVYPEVENIYDSTVAKIVLDEPINPGGSVKINFKYSVNVPKAGKRFGYASGRNFFFISQWFPKVGVFEEGNWICSQYHPFTNFYSDFGHYNVNITVPDNYKVAATGIQKKKTDLKNGKSVYSFIQKGVHDFAWMASDEIYAEQNSYKRRDSSEIQIKLFIQPENEKYKDRFIASVKNALEFFEENIGTYPYQTITIVDCPRTSQSGGMEYPTLITTGATLFSPLKTRQPEYVTIHEFTHQFFCGVVANNEVYEAWLDEGLTSYISTKIVEKYYGKGKIHFDLLGFYPIFGLNLLSYKEIPLVYTLGNYDQEEADDMLAKYYISPTSSTILDTSFKLPNASIYGIVSYAKPQLVLHSLERYLGFNKLMSIFREYYSEYKFRHPKSEDFLSVIKSKCNPEVSVMIDNFFRQASSFDYRVNSIGSAGNGEYEVFIEKIGEGTFPQDIAFYTDKDTLYKKWDGVDRWKIIKFRTNNEVVGAELDPTHKNILDLNYANNSYLLNKQYGASLRLSFRFFFWLQNLLLILGSIS